MDDDSGWKIIIRTMITHDIEQRLQKPKFASTDFESRYADYRRQFILRLF